jgi:hypothetical protein
MAGEPAKAMRGGCLGGMIGAFLGIVIGWYTGYLVATSNGDIDITDKVTANPSSVISAIMADSWLGFVRMLLGAGIGGMIGGIGGSVLGALWGAGVLRRKRAASSPSGNAGSDSAPQRPIDPPDEEVARLKERIAELEQRKRTETESQHEQPS